MADILYVAERKGTDKLPSDDLSQSFLPNDCRKLDQFFHYAIVAHFIRETIGHRFDGTDSE